MKTITVELFNYDELSDEAKTKACEWYAELGYSYDWWEYTYEDAARIGLKITSFDLDRHRHAKGELMEDAHNVAKRILAEHGPDCETFKTASAFLKDVKIQEEAKRAALADMTDEEADDYDDREHEESLEALAQSFEKELLEDYSILLQHEWDSMQTEEYIGENIRANEYTFTKEGKRMG